MSAVRLYLPIREKTAQTFVESASSAERCAREELQGVCGSYKLRSYFTLPK